MSKAYAYIANTTSQTLAGGGAVDMGNAIHGFGLTCCQKTIDVTGNNVTLRAGGYYDIDVTATVSDSAAGNVTLTAYQDGTPITGATVSTAIATADDPASAAITFGVKVSPCASSIITVVATATAGNPIITNIGMTVEKM